MTFTVPQMDIEYQTYCFYFHIQLFLHLSQTDCKLSPSHKLAKFITYEIQQGEACLVSVMSISLQTAHCLKCIIYNSA